MKTQIYEIKQLDAVYYNLMFRGKILNNDFSLNYYEIQNNSRIYLIKNLKSGAFDKTSGRENY